MADRPARRGRREATREKSAAGTVGAEAAAVVGATVVVVVAAAAAGAALKEVAAEEVELRLLRLRWSRVRIDRMDMMTVLKWKTLKKFLL